MKLKELFEAENIIDNVNGLGAVPFNQEVDYLGLRVSMQPSTFLSLSAYLAREDATSVEHIKQHLQNQGKIGAPWLWIVIPNEWFSGDFSKPASVYQHEGRNRMYAIEELYGNIPVEVHLILRNGLRASDLTPEIIKHLNEKMIPEKRILPKNGPLFQVIK